MSLHRAEQKGRSALIRWFFADGAAHVRTSCTTGALAFAFQLAMAQWASSPQIQWPQGSCAERHAGPLRSVCGLVCSSAQNRLRSALKTPAGAAGGAESFAAARFTLSAAAGDRSAPVLISTVTMARVRSHEHAATAQRHPSAPAQPRFDPELRCLRNHHRRSSTSVTSDHSRQACTCGSSPSSRTSGSCPASAAMASAEARMV